MTRLIILLMIVSVSSNASAKELLLCQSQGNADVVISLKDRQAFRHNLDCISGDFISDMTPCAPEAGFGLSAPTGRASLVAVVDRWQDYIDHLGGVAGHYITSVAPPGKHQALAHAVSGCDSADQSTRLVALGNDPKLVRRAPAPPKFPPSDEFHHAIHNHHLNYQLNVESGLLQAVLGRGIRCSPAGPKTKYGIKLPA
jgi:hypothetical protein